ncbi:MAG: hypothetical protein PHF29_01640 [Candidatus Riflebacteria bacterium]|nr:hypothetical protein [Candidatus Riflebacteria bacterium]
MNINFKNNRLDAIFEQLNFSKAKKDNNLNKVMSELSAKSKELKENKKANKDSVELSDKSKDLAKNFAMSQTEQKSVLSQSSVEYTDDMAADDAESAQSIQAGGYNISFQFDMFYELTSKVEAQMGKSGAERFVSLGATVAETFKSNFSLSIDPVGSFMNGTEQSLAISNETTNAFFDAVEGMADLSPESLENFLKESDNFFAELESTYGEAEGAFDAIKDVMQNQAKDFFAKVDEMKSSVLQGSEQKPAIPASPVSGEVPEAEAVAADSLKPSESDALSVLLPQDEEEPEDDLISMFFNKDVKLSQEDYSDFLGDFQSFAEKIKSSMFSKLLNKPQVQPKTEQKGINITA